MDRLKSHYIHIALALLFCFSIFNAWQIHSLERDTLSTFKALGGLLIQSKVAVDVNGVISPNRVITEADVQAAQSSMGAPF
jgi:hypothetical protein